MATIRQVNDAQSAAALASLLNGDGRAKPVVVVTVPAGRSEPWIDVDEIAREAGDLADVYLMPTGAFTWEFSRQMAEGTQVYGGAGRVYPVGHEWTSQLGRSPLRFAFNDADGKQATLLLISDLLRMAVAAGLVKLGDTADLREATGVVQGVVARRGLVKVGSSTLAAVAEELTLPDVGIEQILQVGQEVAGSYDPKTNRLDITAHLRPAEEALADYHVGDVVLTRVAKVSANRADLVLYPKVGASAVVATVHREAVTTNPADDLRTLMTVGEVLPARVANTGPDWLLVLYDIDDDEPIVVPPSLLPGGPSWLVEEDEASALSELPPLTPPPASMPSPFEEEESPTPAVPLEPQAPAPPASPRPTPTMFDRKPPAAPSTPPSAPTPAALAVPKPGPRPGQVPRPGPQQTRPVPKPGLPTPAAMALPPSAAATPAPAPAESTKQLLLKIDGQAADLKALRGDVDELRNQLRAALDERDQLRYLLERQDRRANEAEHKLKGMRAQLRRASRAKPAMTPEEAPQFADAEQGFRYLVLTRWAVRTPVSEQGQRPLPDFRIGPQFLDSLAQLEGIKPEKVADVVVEIVMGRAQELTGREVHRLRTGPGGKDPVRTRPDGAVAYRASLQVKTPSARRIHYWQCADGVVELARVATHDDFEA